MLLAIQTTSEGVDDSTLDAVTLVLLVGFIVSLVALSLLLARRQPDTQPERETNREPEPARSIPPAPAPRPRADMQSVVVTAPIAPAWLAGVTLPRSEHPLSEATAMVERLLEARRSRDLAAGIALFSPSYRMSLASDLGVPANGLDDALAAAAIDGDPPALRSVELVSATGDSMRVRAGYTDRSSEIYRLERINGRWLIDSIERG